jgi:hypothetical protein
LNVNNQYEFDPLAEHFDGKSWSLVSTPTLPNGGILYSVAAAASNDVWAVGFRYASDGITIDSSVIEHWTGSSWSLVESGRLQGAQFHGVTAIASNDVYAVGGDGGNNALVEHWNGRTWSRVSSTAFNNVGSIDAVSADASNDVWAVGCCGPLGTGQAILHWNGTSWSLVSSHPRFGPVAITALSPSNVWVAGTVEDSDNDSHLAAVEHWDGTNWSIVSSPNPNPGVDQNSHLKGIAAVSANDIWAAGDIGAPFGHIQTLTEHWDGTSWSVIASPNPGTSANRLNAVTALSDGTVAAVGHQEGGTVNQPLILQNAASAPKAATLTPAQTTTLVPPPLDDAPGKTAVIEIAAPTRATSAPLDAAQVDQFFAAAAKSNQPSPFQVHRSRAQTATASGQRDGLQEGLWLWDEA